MPVHGTVAEGYVEMFEGTWTPCVRFLRDGREVREPVRMRLYESRDLRQAIRVAHIEAYRLNSASGSDTVKRSTVQEE